MRTFPFVFSTLVFSLLFGPLSVGSVAFAEATESQKLWAEYIKSPDAHSHIPNNSFAGFLGSRFEKPTKIKRKILSFPTVEEIEKKKSSFVKEFDRLVRSVPENEAIEVRIPAGRYVLSEQWKVQRSWIHIRGAGQEKTEIVFLKPLWDLLPSKIEDGRSPYAWSRGLIEVSPKVPANGDFNGWEVGKELGKITGEYAVGARSVEYKGRPIKGPRILILRWDLKNPQVLNYMAGKPDSKWLAEAKHWRNRKFFYWPVWMTPSASGKIQFPQPLRLPIQKGDLVEVLELADHLEMVELSDFSISTNRSRAEAHLQEKGYNGIFVHRVIDSNIHNIRVKNVDNALLFNAVKNSTASKIEILGDLSTHHGTFHKYADDCLVEDFTFSAPLIHGINADLRGSGNVWRRGRLKFGSIDMHRGMQFDLIRTNIEFEKNSGNSGGDQDAGPMQGRRVVHWNLSVKGKSVKNIYEPQFFPFGVIAGIQFAGNFPKQKEDIHTKILDLNKTVEPADLYEGQVQLQQNSFLSSPK